MLEASPPFRDRLRASGHGRERSHTVASGLLVAYLVSRRRQSHTIRMDLRVSTTKRQGTTAPKERPKQARPEPNLPAGMDDGGQNLNKVRDILFGADMRTIEERLTFLEQRLTDEASRIREDADQRFERLESALRQELAAVGDQLQAERSERTDEAAALAKQLKDAADALDHRIGSLDERLTTRGESLGKQLRDESHTLAEQLRQTSEQMTARIDRELSEIRTSKPNTAVLAALFADLTERLRDESPPTD